MRKLLAVSVLGTAAVSLTLAFAGPAAAAHGKPTPSSTAAHKPSGKPVAGVKKPHPSVSPSTSAGTDDKGGKNRRTK